MKLTSLILFNAILFIILGIAFALYGPIMINFFGMLAISGADGGAYWFTASFARLLGAAFFGYGFLLWAVQNILSGSDIPAENRRKLTLALLIGNILALFVTITQQWQVWANLAGWLISGIFTLLTAGYSIMLIRKSG